MITIDRDLCTGCGLCGDICPRHVPEIITDGGNKFSKPSEDRAHICINCAHCALVCRTQAIFVDGMQPGDVVDVPSVDASKAQLFSVLQHRRSVRRYRSDPVPRKLLEQVAQSAHWAPMVASSGTLGITIVDDPDKLKVVSSMLVDLYDALMKGLSNPIGRMVVKRKVGNRFATVNDFLKPGLEWYLEWYHNGSSNEIIRDAPAIMLFHAPTTEPDIEASVTIAAWNAILTAETLGLGSLYNGLLPDGVNRNPRLREYLELSDDRKVYAGLSLGYAKFKLKKTVRRGVSGVKFL